MNQKDRKGKKKSKSSESSEDSGEENGEIEENDEIIMKDISSDDKTPEKPRNDEVTSVQNLLDRKEAVD